MKPSNAHETSHCEAISTTLQRLGDKWTVIVIAELGEGKRRFNELRAAIGTISQKMLTSTLRQLEDDGFVTRTVYPTIPPRVEYELTDMGRSFLEPVTGLIHWAKENAARLAEAKLRRQLGLASAAPTLRVSPSVYRLRPVQP